MTRSLLILAGITVLLYGAACTALFFLQRSLLYFPTPQSTPPYPATLTLPVADARVLVTTRPHAGPDAVVYFGGNAEDVTRSLPGLRAAFPERALYLMHYRGYSGSTGSPSERALVADAKVLFDTVRAGHPNVTVIGRSLGSGLAVQVAAQRTVERLVLVTPFDSIQGLAAVQFPYFPVRWLLLDKYESGRYATAVTAPTVLIRAERDEVIPATSTAALYRRFRPGIATLFTIEGAQHNTVADSARYIPLLQGGPP